LDAYYALTGLEVFISVDITLFIIYNNNTNTSRGITMDKKIIYGFSHLCSSIWKNYNFNHLPDLMSELLFNKQYITTLRREVEHTSSSHISEFYNGNVRSGQSSFANPNFAKYLLYSYDSNVSFFGELVLKCRQRFNTDDEYKKFVPDKYYLAIYEGKENCVYAKFIDWANGEKNNKYLQKSILTFSACLKRYIQEEKYEYAMAMLILFSFLNSDVFYLNDKFNRLNYEATPTTKFEDNAEYIIKPYINFDTHLAIKNYTDSVNHTVDKSCIPRNVLVTINDCNMNGHEAVFKIKKLRGNTYHIMQGEKYLQFLGITSNSRIVAYDDLNNRCRWRLIKVEDVDAFLIVPVSSNRIISRFSAVDVPNGAAIDNLPLWIFLNNSTRSQMFKFYKVL